MGIKYFKECCNKLGVDVDNTFCCGSSRITTNISNNARYMFYPTENQLKKHHKFAVKYFATEEMYLCWNIQQKVKRTKFGCKKQDAIEALKGNTNYLVKNIVSRNGDKEKVYAFKKENVVDFLKCLQKNFL